MPDRLWSLLVMCTFALASCSSTDWVHRHKKKEEFVYDYNQCQREVFNQSSFQMIPLTDYQQNVRVEQCVRKQGWAKIRR